MRSGETVGGFELVRTTPVEDIGARAHLFRHLGTGAELLWLERKDRNKTFAAAFRTIPEDDTGVFHILEHSVLCGSARYPVKEPFVELLKGSLSTFLNAMTFPDKTVYPVASRNDTDFRSLMRVYLDAVFCPAIYENENIFLQEGWHYEWDESGQPRRVGVVYGEMTGAFSSVDEVIGTGITRLLFPDTCYGRVSGGDPEHIPELTYEAFLAAHRRFYHPSNALFFLDGELDAADILAELDREYLSKYGRRAQEPGPGRQRLLPYREAQLKYAVTPGEENGQRAHFALGSIAGDWRDVVRNLALLVLRDCLCGSNSAPLKRAVLESGLCQDLSFDVESDMAQSLVLLQLRNTSEDKLPGLKLRLQQLIAEIAERGLDRDELAASLNRLEFLSGERREPYGVQLALLAYRAWMYGGEPELYLNTSAAFKALREKLDTPYFEDLLKELFLSGEGLAALHVLPSVTLEAEDTGRRQSRLLAELSKLGEEGRARLREKAEALSLWHRTPDSAKALASIPHLSPDELPSEPLLTRVGEESLLGVRVLRPEVDAPRTAYLDLYFALPGAGPGTLSAAALLAELLTELPTARHTAPELQRAVKAELGELSFAVDVYSRPGEPEVCTPYFRASVSVLGQKLDAAAELAAEVLLETEFDHPDKVGEVLRQALTRQQQNIILAGHSCAMRRALSGLTAEGAALERTDGYAYYYWLRGLCAQPDAAIPGLLQELAQLRAAFTRANLTLSAAGDVSASRIERLLERFPEGVKKDAGLSFGTLRPVRDAIVIPAGIGYAVKAAELYRAGGRVSGSMDLAGKLLSLDYLWNEVRVKGGAYGAGLNVTPNGSVFAYSYRDPDPARTLAVFDGAAEYLRRCCAEKRDLGQLIIGAVSDSEPLRSARDEALAAAARVLRGISEEDKRKQRQELLGTTHEELLECSRVLEAAASSCVTAGETLAEACQMERTLLL